jgi:hypothetical protein
VTGLNLFSIDRQSESFKRSFRKLYKGTAVGLKPILLDQLESVITGLAEDQRPTLSGMEPCPKKIIVPPLCEFRKLTFTISTGAAGQIRLMYLVNFDLRLIKPLFVYSHKQFATRPSDSEMRDFMKVALDEGNI